MESLEMAFEMPLLNLLMFQQNALTMSPEDIINGLLQQVHTME